MICAGIDAGSRAVKIVMVDAVSGEIIGKSIADQGTDIAASASQLLDKALADVGITKSDVGRIVATGYGRNSIGFADKTVTEITCHAVGVRNVATDARTVVEIGGQDSKLLRLDDRGNLHDFAMNDRCAAGTGCFLEVVARRFSVGMDQLGELAKSSSCPASISSTCVVFADTEIVSLLASGESPANIAAGVQKSIATRIAAMAGGRVVAPVLFSGGVALVPGMDERLASALAEPVMVSPIPQFTGALGAAILACKEG